MRIETRSLAWLQSGNARLPGGVAIVALLLMLALPFFGFAAGNGIWLAWFGALVTFVLAMVAWQVQRIGDGIGQLQRGRAGSIVIERGELVAKTDRLDTRFPLTSIVAGLREELGVSHQVLLDVEGGDRLVLSVASAEQASELLDALGVGLRQRALTLRLTRVRGDAARALLTLVGVFSGLLATPFTLLTLLLAPVAAVHPTDDSVRWFFGSAAFCALLWVVIVLTFRALAVRTLTIGRDGVTIQLGFFAPKFVPFEGMEVFRDGRTVMLTRHQRMVRFSASSSGEAIALVKRIEEARALCFERGVTRNELIARNGRDATAWLDAMRGLVEGATDYRSGLDRRELAAIAEDPSLPPDHRVGAAAALSALPTDAPERGRLRVAIDSTADPKLRLALERAAVGDLDVITLEEAERHRAR